jgi:hypothetical protein
MTVIFSSACSTDFNLGKKISDYLEPLSFWLSSYISISVQTKR